MSEWEIITPKVNESAEFLEIASDFGKAIQSRYNDFLRP